MKDRPQLLDQLLVFSATFVVVLGLWPAQAKRQVLHCQTGVDAESNTQQWTTYSIPVDHPSLAKLKESVERWQTPENDPVYVTAKWRKQVAEFYEKSSPCKSDSLNAEDCVGTNVEDDAEQHTPKSRRRSHSGPTTASISDSVITASYEIPVDEDAVPSCSDLVITESNKAKLQAKESAGAIRQVDYQVTLNEVPQADLAPKHQPATETKSLAKTNSVAQADAELSMVADASSASADETSADVRYWQQVKESAAASIEQIETRAANPPVIIGEVTKAGPSQFAFNLAVLLAIAAVCGYMHWFKLTPMQAGVEYRDQPIGVLARLGTFGGIVTLAFISAVVVWY
ncbi:hypothetical protein [Rhodopirellula sp. MGV]|uniref:hypothetical protein n=1 Tax=Rhodopirellula sp. MGV TaxID=2023130 RepID=UPI000B96AFFA|nr:hypothetical protein [Rhodopirellula sp. MGV]OYP34460.1 hypothetical protein CGZ80_15580 [Rhodopirellula sp. MGV]PNY37364.1 hypothetical protein C2E31_07440 [Rhodopirellula baltica]